MSSKKHNYYYARTLSLESCVGDWEPRQDDAFNFIEDNDYKKNICDSTQGAKKDIISLILEGFNLNQISKILQIKQSKIYKIKRELMQELKFLKKGELPQISKRMQLIENLILLYFLIYPKITAEKMDKIWEKDKVLKEYRKPPYNIIAENINELKAFFKLKHGN